MTMFLMEDMTDDNAPEGESQGEALQATRGSICLFGRFNYASRMALARILVDGYSLLQY